MPGRIDTIQLTFLLEPNAALKARMQALGHFPFHVKYEGFTYHFKTEQEIQVQAYDRHAMEKARTGFFMLIQYYKRDHRGCLRHIVYSAKGHLGAPILARAGQPLAQLIHRTLPAMAQVDIQANGQILIQGIHKETLLYQLHHELSMCLNYEINNNKN